MWPCLRTLLPSRMSSLGTASSLWAHSSNARGCRLVVVTGWNSPVIVVGWDLSGLVVVGVDSSSLGVICLDWSWLGSVRRRPCPRWFCSRWPFVFGRNSPPLVVVGVMLVVLCWIPPVWSSNCRGFPLLRHFVSLSFTTSFYPPHTPPFPFSRPSFPPPSRPHPFGKGRGG